MELARRCGRYRHCCSSIRRLVGTAAEHRLFVTGPIKGDSGEVRDDVEWEELPASPPPEGDEPAEPAPPSRGPDWLTRLGRALQHPPWPAQVVAVAILVGGLLAYTATRSLSDRAHPHAVSQTPTQTPQQQAGAEENLAMIALLAQLNHPLNDFVRPASTANACTIVPPGHYPRGSISAAIHRVLPNFVVRDVGRTLDQYTAMCAIVVRARDAVGSVLVLDVVAPGGVPTYLPQPQLIVESMTERGDTVIGATVITNGGWNVVAGVVGQVDDEPNSNDLLRLAQDPGLLW